LCLAWYPVLSFALQR